MGNGINLTAIFIANGMALLLAAQLLFGDSLKHTNNNVENRFIRFLIYMGALACIIDPIVFLADGHPGLTYWLIVYIGNMILFIEDLIVGLGWIVLVCTHLNGTVPNYQKRIIASLFTVGIIAIIANLFVPIVFRVDENSVYHREFLFWLFTFIEGVFILDGIFVYLNAKIKGGIFKFFPVLQFVIPITAGIAVQSAIYGVSLVYPAAMISFMGLQNSLRNEALFMDSLTGLYNRAYMDSISDEIAKKSAAFSATVFVLDINCFKSINDRFGHAEGDIALIRTAHILKTTVGALGSVARYAGDEFVILLNTDQKELIDGCISSIHRAFEEENRSSGKEYNLSVSIGYCPINGHEQTLYDVLSEADRAMYADKKLFYSDPSRDRRK